MGNRKGMVWNAIITDLRLSMRPYRTIKQCAEAVGVRPEAWGHWEKGDINPSGKNRRKIAYLFGVQVNVIWGGDSDAADEK